MNSMTLKSDNFKEELEEFTDVHGLKRIAMITASPDLRMLSKHSPALDPDKWGIDLITAQMPEDSGLFQHIQWFSYYTPFYNGSRSQGQLEECLDASKADLWHTHENPSWLAQVCQAYKKRTGNKTPVITEIHDSEIGNLGKWSAYDEALIKWNQDGFIFVSDEMGEMFEHYYGLDGRPWISLFPYVSLKYYPRVLKEEFSIDGMVYQGAADFESKPSKDLREVLTALKSSVIRLYLYANDLNGKGKEVYRAFGAHVEGKEKYSTLIQTLNKYRWGLCGWFGKETGKLSEHGVNNKFFEYIAAGIPIIVINSRIMGDMVEKYGIGVSIKDARDIPDIYEDSEKYRAKVQEIRFDFSMENHIHVLEDFYNKFI